MAEAPVRTASDLARRQNALADIQFASIADDDLTPSEDESPEERLLELETVQSAIGVSIGQQQTRLTSPKTPAAEKAAALESTEDGLFFEGWEQAPDAVSHVKDGSPTIQAISTGAGLSTRENVPLQGEVNVPRETRPHESAPPAQTRLPSPWRAGARTFNEKVSDHRTILRDHLQGRAGRRRASSNGSMTDVMRKYMPFNLPSSISKSYKDLHFSLPSFSSLSLLEPDRSAQAPAANERQRRQTFASGPRLAGIPQHDGSTHSAQQSNRSVPTVEPSASLIPTPAHPPQRGLSDDSTTTLIVQPPRHSRDRPVPRLRRSNSEGSLMAYRTKSFASSLGDDSRFESVQEMANSRLKALKDSWQDSNFKLPSPSFPNFNFGARDDLFRKSSGAATPKALEVNESATHRDSLKTINSSSSRRASIKPRRAANGNSSDGEAHPFFTQALQELEGDLVVMGGYRGSVLRSAEPPNRQLWVPIKVGLNLRKVDLEVPLDEDADENMEKTIIPSGMLTHIGPVDISKRLFKRLNACENARNGKLRVHNYGYDWRLSPHFLSKRLIKFLESLPCNQPDVAPEKRGAWVVAHSLGGLITRHAINERPELVAGIVYAGVPQRCVNILGPFRNGDDVLLSSRVLTAQVNFTIRTSYALLPLDGKCFINKHTKEEYPVDFFDVNTWKEHRLSPCIAAPVPRPEQPKDASPFSVSGLVNAMSSALPSFPARKGSFSLSKTLQGTSSSSTENTNTNTNTTKDLTSAAHKAADKVAEGTSTSAGMEPQMSPSHGQQSETSREPNPATDVSIPYDKAVSYLTRTLAQVKRFKQELAHNPTHTASNTYPPIALIYGKSTPTVVGAKVESREAIKRADVYDELAFASGDGVVLARAAMVPEGYSVARGGVVSSDRGHVTLLGDLEAVGRCLCAVMRARSGGVGLGKGRVKVREGRQGDSERLGIQGLSGGEGRGNG